MGRSALAPIPITGPLLVPIGGQLDQLRGIKAGNESDQTLFWEWGDQSGYLYPSEVDVLRPGNQPSLGGIRVRPTQVLPQGLGLTQQLLVEYAFGDDDFPGPWPQQMSRLTQRVTSPTEQVIMLSQVGVGTKTQVLTPPPGTLAIGLLFNKMSGVDFVNTTLIGNGTGQDYLHTGLAANSTVLSQVQQLYRILFDFSDDATLTFNLAVNLATTINCWVIFLTDTTTISISPNQVVQISDTLNNSTYLSKIVSANFVGGTAQNVIPALVNETIFLHDIFLVANAATNVTVQNAGGGSVFAQGSANAAGVALDWDGKGRATAIGDRIDLLTSVNAGINGVLGYKQF